MSEVWTECAPESGVYRSSYTYPAFGEVTSLAFRLESGRWAIFSPPPKPEPDAMAFFDREGVEALVAPNFAHLSGLRDWLKRYPEARFHAADRVLGGAHRLAKIEPRPVSALKPEAGIELIEAPGTRCGSVWLRSCKGDTKVVYLDEILITMNARPARWFSRLIFRMSGTRPGLGLNRLFLKTLCDDPGAHLRGALELADGANVVCVAHGPAIAAEAALVESRHLLKAASDKQR
ncbi:MAG: hypothetical protein V2I43_00710 [Parvularcula sp.]|nr:hypothetical protein [Parvularcula sp.]